MHFHSYLLDFNTKHLKKKKLSRNENENVPKLC